MKHMVANTSRSCLLRFRASCSILITFLPFLSSSPSRNRINNNGVSRMMWENVTHLALHLALHLPLLLHFLPLGVLSVADSRAAQTVSSEVFSTAPVPFPPSGGSVFPSPTSSGWSRVPSLGDPAPPSLHSPYLQLTPINLDPSTQPLKDINIVQHRIGMDAGNVMFNATELDRITNLYREVFSAYTFLVTVHSQQLTKTSDIPVTLMSTEHDQLTVSEVASSSPVTSSVSYSDEIAVPRLLQSGGYVISVVINIYPFQEVSVYALGFAVSDLQTVIMERFPSVIGYRTNVYFQGINLYKMPVHCTDKLLNSYEMDRDCGGWRSGCPRCQDSKYCLFASDCMSNTCVKGFCAKYDGQMTVLTAAAGQSWSHVPLIVSPIVFVTIQVIVAIVYLHPV